MRDHTDTPPDTPPRRRAGPRPAPAGAADTPDASLPPAMAGHAPSSTPFIGTGPAMQDLYRLISAAAASNASVFITGASGTGKDVCARAIHDFSPRAARPFMALNCASLPAGLLESALFGHVKGAFTGAGAGHDGAVTRAEGGTLFLDELCDMPLDIQAKMLRFLQNLTYTKVGGTREYRANIRVICATNKNPAEEMLHGRLREDLYYRLHVIPIAMPALAGRAGDILDLADYYLHLYAAEEGKNFVRFSSAAEAFLLQHNWPGNVRELQNMIRHAVVLHTGPQVELPMLTALLAAASAPSCPAGTGENAALCGPLPPLWQIEKNAIETALALSDGNVLQAAAMLQIAPSTIYRKMQGWEERR